METVDSLDRSSRSLFHFDSFFLFLFFFFFFSFSVLFLAKLGFVCMVSVEEGGICGIMIDDGRSHDYWHWVALGRLDRDIVGFNGGKSAWAGRMDGIWGHGVWVHEAVARKGMDGGSWFMHVVCSYLYGGMGGFEG